jgi:hypothetical protein
VVLQWFYDGVTVVLHSSKGTLVSWWCRNGVIVVLQWCYSIEYHRVGVGGDRRRRGRGETACVCVCVCVCVFLCGCVYFVCVCVCVSVSV